MFKLGLSLVIIALIVGCSSKREDDLMKAYAKNINYHKKLQKTEKVQFYEDNVTKVVLTATYLYTPTLEKKDRRQERFIVGIHVEDNATSVDIDDFNLTVNGKKANKTIILKQGDKRLDKVSFVTNWGNYYLMKFPHAKSKKVKLKYDNAAYGKGILNFAKVAKYVLTKKKL